MRIVTKQTLRFERPTDNPVAPEEFVAPAREVVVAPDWIASTRLFALAQQGNTIEVLDGGKEAPQEAPSRSRRRPVVGPEADKAPKEE